MCRTSPSVTTASRQGAAEPRATMGCCGCDTYEDTQYLSGICGANFAVFMSLVELVIRSQCKIADPCGRLGRSNPELLEEYDMVVVGAGVAGSAVAARLSERPDWSVLLIEAGPDEPAVSLLPAFAVSAIGTKLDWRYRTQPQSTACLRNGGVCKWPRGKMVSGTGAMNGMMYTRGNRKIYDEWAAAGNVGWSYDEVLPYFIKSERNGNPDLVEPEYHGTSGPMTVQQFSHHPPFAEAILEAGEEMGYRKGDLNGANQTGMAIAQMMVEDGLRASPGRMYLRKHARNHSNLQVLLNTLVTKVIVDSSHYRATGVEYRTKDGDIGIIRARKEVIVCAGAVDSPKLLLLSGIGPSEDLERHGIPVVKDLAVGRNLRNHVAVRVPFTVNDTWVQTLTTATLKEFVETQGGPMAGTGSTQATGFFLSRYAQNGVPDLQVFFDGFGARCSRTGMEGECHDGSLGQCGRRRVSARPTNVMPQSVGYLTLGSADPTQPPLIYPNYLTVRRDLEILLEGIRAVVRLSETEALKGRWDMQLDTNPVPGCEAYTFGTDQYWECVIRRHTVPENHQGGSCKMGPRGDPNAVVDARLKVHGIENLRVIDASIYPYIPNSNTIASVLMIAEKGADMIKEDWTANTT